MSTLVDLNPFKPEDKPVSEQKEPEVIVPAKPSPKNEREIQLSCSLDWIIQQLPYEVPDNVHKHKNWRFVQMSRVDTGQLIHTMDDFRGLKDEDLVMVHP